MFPTKHLFLFQHVHCTLARWLKNVLELSGIRNLTAHVFCGTSALVAYLSGLSIKEIMDAAIDPRQRHSLSFTTKKE